jgi:hypothetical protein
MSFCFRKILEFGKLHREDENPPFLRRTPQKFWVLLIPEYFIIVDFSPPGLKEKKLSKFDNCSSKNGCH